MTKSQNVFAKHALLEMHATLAGELQASNEHYFGVLRKMREIESVIKMMDPEFRINRIAVRRMQPNGFFKRGTVTRLCLTVLREAGEPLTVRQIIDRALVPKGFNPDAEKAAKVRPVFHNALRNQVGITLRVTHEGPIVRFETINKT
jgi:hypothetical protein